MVKAKQEATYENLKVAIENFIKECFGPNEQIAKEDPELAQWLQEGLDYELQNIHFRTAEDFKRIGGDILSGAKLVMSFEGSILYDFFNYGTDNGEFGDKLYNLLKTEFDCMYELGYAWCIGVYED